MKLTYEKDASNVEHKCNTSIEEEHGQARVGEILILKGRDLGAEGDNNVEEGANGGIVVEGNERVHLHALRGEHDLNHDEANGLKDDAEDLVDEANHGKVNLAETGNGDTDDNDHDVEKLGEVGLCDAKGPRGE